MQFRKNNFTMDFDRAAASSTSLGSEVVMAEINFKKNWGERRTVEAFSSSVQCID